jgi:hypothetical protein
VLNILITTRYLFEILDFYQEVRRGTMERPSYVAALSVPFLRQAMIEVTEDKVDAGHMADVQIERYFRSNVY